MFKLFNRILGKKKQKSTDEELVSSMSGKLEEYEVERLYMEKYGFSNTNASFTQKLDDISIQTLHDSISFDDNVSYFDEVFDKDKFQNYSPNGYMGALMMSVHRTNKNKNS